MTTYETVLAAIADALAAGDRAKAERALLEYATHRYREGYQDGMNYSQTTLEDLLDD